MTDLPSMSPAERAAQKAIAAVHECIDAGQSFRLEAGAGAGKTYSLIKALQHLIHTRGRALLRKRQRVACITYTNVARDEIESRIDGHPAVVASTIHSFCWSLIKDFQPFLKQAVAGLGKWPERLSEAGGVGDRAVEYDLGYPTITDDAVCLSHDDVLLLTVAIMDEPKFRWTWVSRYPILLIDEYQDTNAGFAAALLKHYLGVDPSPLIGLFGDHWQKIYRDGCGLIKHDSLRVINKGANFRSVPAVVDVLNNIRPELPQDVADPEAEGCVAVYHTNDWACTRRTESHWKGDLPADAAHECLHSLIEQLKTAGWDFSPERTKILMLTHNVLATEQGYPRLAAVFKHNDQFIKKENDHIAFLVDTLEPLCDAYEQKRFGDMFEILGRPVLRSKDDKDRWAHLMDALVQARNTFTVGEVIDVVKKQEPKLLPRDVSRREREIEECGDELKEDEPSSLKVVRCLREVSYQEVRALAAFVDGHTPFSTKHGVKGAEFENVLVVLGRGWNQYNFGDMLEWVASGVPKGKEKAFVRNRNLFYVVCSRPETRLALLFTQQLSSQALRTLASWFGEGNIQAIARS